MFYRNSYPFRYLALIVAFTFSYFFYFGGFDPIPLHSDMLRYYDFYNDLRELSNFSEFFNVSIASDIDPLKDPLFKILFYIFSQLGFTFQNVLLLFIFLFYYIFFYIAYSVRYTHYLFILILFFLVSFWMTSLINVVLRQGISFLFLLLFLYSLSNKNFLRSFIFLLTSYFLHGVAILVIPFLFIRRFFKRNLNLTSFIFLLVYVAYITGALALASEFLKDVVGLLGIDMRSLKANNSYITGPTLMKSIAIIVPFILIRIAGQASMPSIIRELYIFYLYIEIIGMAYSGFPYNDRIMIIGWALSPFFIVHFFSIYFYRIRKGFSNNDKIC